MPPANPLAVLRGLLPARFRPSSRSQLALEDIADDGTLVPRRGPLRAVLRLPPEGLDADTASAAALQRLAAAVNAGAGRATLLAWGSPTRWPGSSRSAGTACDACRPARA